MVLVPSMSAPLREALGTYLVVSGLAFAITRLRAVPAVSGYVHLMIGALFLVATLWGAQRDPGGTRRLGVDLGGLLEPSEDERPPGPLGLFELARAVGRALPSGLREAGIATLLALLVFPPFALGFRLWHGANHPFVFVPPPAFADVILTQLLVIALPEEAFFRGYLQTRLDDAFPMKRAILGARLSPASVTAQAALFAALHFAVEPRVDRLAVFFPGLLFGWLRAARGGIGAAVVFHAASNVLSEILARGWLQ